MNLLEKVIVLENEAENFGFRWGQSNYGENSERMFGN